MKTSPYKFFSTALIVFFVTAAYAQQAAVSSGGDATGSGGTVSYSVGQPVYTTNNGSTGTITQGVQQPYEIFIITGVEEKNIKLSVNAYPNPTEHFLTISVKNNEGRELSYQLTDITGKILVQQQLTDNTTDIMVSHLAAATYILSVNENGKELKSFRIVKTKN